MKSLTNDKQTTLSAINQNKPTEEKDELQDIIDALLSGKEIPKDDTQDIDDDIDWALVELYSNYYDSLEGESLEWALQQEF